MIPYSQTAARPVVAALGSVCTHSLQFAFTDSSGDQTHFHSGSNSHFKNLPGNTDGT